MGPCCSMVLLDQLWHLLSSESYVKRAAGNAEELACKGCRHLCKTFHGLSVASLGTQSFSHQICQAEPGKGPHVELKEAAEKSIYSFATRPGDLDDQQAVCCQ